jgi:hypothetical protein
MQAREVIEGMIISELKGLCTSCAHSGTCVYFKSSERIILQCELFRVNDGDVHDPDAPQGLCTSCDHARQCTLSGRKTGVWHCNEFS